MNIQNGAWAPTGSLGPKKVQTVVFTDLQTEQIRAAAVAYRRLFEIRAIAPEWSQAHAEWQYLAERVAADLIAHLERIEGGHHARAD
jgi:hypothetical protein